MADVVLNDLLLLQSYFCKPGEFSVNRSMESINASDETNFIITLMLEIQKDDIVEIQFNVTSFELQNCFADANHLCLKSTTGYISRRILQNFKEVVMDYQRLLCDNGDLSLFNLLTWIPDKLNNYIKEKIERGNSKTSCFESEKFSTALLTIDHIRSRSRYLKFMKNTSQNLQIGLELIYYQTRIFLIVFGLSLSVKEYIKLQRTSLVDVDNSGKPCKEKMLKVVEIRERKTLPSSFTGLNCMEVTNIEELRNKFKNFSFLHMA
ncbi:RWD domain-containing protein 3-like [Hydractinia symbiolongicarpus]|uniref:RWD domain-containing protein 3-like n=1 Tax=Hydractinia symbiolongicarpus TaxID=13093 RepID=UPI00254C928B|nr:RWD domain-containing protein 3-like [Hydractinia symbiolongicarpus]